MTIRALTIRQPWAWYIARGPKRIENRTWKPPASLLGQYLAIHAGKALDRRGDGEVADALQFVRGMIADGLVRADDIAPGELADLPLGAVVAVARVDGCVTESADPWFCGPFGWTLADVVAIEPVPCRGAQGLWPIPPDVLATVRERWKAAR